MQLPLTFQQQWLWDLLQRRRDWTCAVTYAFRLKGGLKFDVLQSSLREVIRRHGALHTRIRTVEGIPTQETGDWRASQLTMTPVAGSSAMEIREHAEQIFAEFTERQPDPHIGPLFNARLLELDACEHWLLVGLHRLTADCFSADQIFHELWMFYRALAYGLPPPFPADPAQYGDYAIWQQQTRQEWARRHGSYWAEHLDGALALNWPAHTSISGIERGRIGRMSGWFGRALSEDLGNLARKARALSATIMLAVYVSVLWRWCRQHDFVVPFNIAGRQSEHKYVVGYFSHIVYLRIRLTGTETFSDLLARVSNEFFRSLAHQDFGRSASEKPELLSGTFFQWITWQTEAAAEAIGPAAAPDLIAERLSLGNFGEGLSALPSGMVDVDMTFFDTPEGIYAAGLYRADLFTAGTMNRFVSDLRSAAELFIRTPDAPISTACCKTWPSGFNDLDFQTLR